MQKLSASTTSTLISGRKHGLNVAHRIRLPTNISVANRTLRSAAQHPPEKSCRGETRTWKRSPPPSIEQFSASDRRALAGFDEPGSGNEDHKPPDERIVKLGKTLRILSPLLSNVLIHPLPQEILSPSITLHLFPSTHPHLPTVKGRVPYRAALWTAPVAWGSVPIVGDVKLQVLSERIVRAGSVLDMEDPDTCGDEKLVVRWKTEGKGSGSGAASMGTSKAGSDRVASTTDTSPQSLDHTSSTGSSSSGNGTNRGLSALLGGDSPIFKLGKEEQFSGLFIFSFDEEGRVSSHTIEHADEINGWDRTARVVTLTDWLLGKAKWGPSLEPKLAFNRHQDMRAPYLDRGRSRGERCDIDGRLDPGR